MLQLKFNWNTETSKQFFRTCIVLKILFLFCDISISFSRSKKNINSGDKMIQIIL